VDNFFTNLRQKPADPVAPDSYLYQHLEWYEQMENGKNQPQQPCHQERRQQLSKKRTNTKWQLCNGKTDPDSCYTEQPKIC
jgi:hypothetical protein